MINVLDRPSQSVGGEIITFLVFACGIWIALLSSYS